MCVEQDKGALDFFGISFLKSKGIERRRKEILLNGVNGIIM